MTENQILSSTKKSSITPKKNERLPELDAIRAILILYIIGFWHLLGYSSAPRFYINFVTVFITHCVLGGFTFISAFLLGYRYEFKSFNDVKNYFIVRFMRIYPLFLTALSGFFLLKLIDKKTFITSAILLSPILNIRLLTLWFITMLLLFYILVPFLLYNYAAKKVIISSSILFFIVTLLHWKTGLIDLRVIYYFPIFVFGLIVSRTKKLQEMLVNYKILVISLFVLVIVLSLFHSQETLHWSINILVVAFGIFASLPAIWTLGRLSLKIFNKNIIRIISYSSFCMYLTHRIILLGANYYKPTSLLISCLYLLGVWLPLIVLISYFLQYYYDLAVKKILIVENVK
ncbi:acyltransferase [Nostocaceae cyanobacterium CENA369]|uniref:Acyltransferase n=1 Tax=Dendronalium phyllosphericum CENA369 TaxID=1725256 RepID=A0A8J7LDY6_9NOST|nr:acyltransferase family protein [Dendronalium phyllosphericum]MBH8573596.1 acyltransferase [Dendronalium phyllosphericum CENA369]